MRQREKFKLFMKILFEEVWEMYGEPFITFIATVLILSMLVLIVYLIRAFTIVELIFKGIMAISVAILGFILLLLIPYLVLKETWNRYKVLKKNGSELRERIEANKQATKDLWN